MLVLQSCPVPRFNFLIVFQGRSGSNVAKTRRGVGERETGAREIDDRSTSKIITNSLFHTLVIDPLLLQEET